MTGLRWLSVGLVLALVGGLSAGCGGSGGAAVATLREVKGKVEARGTGGAPFQIVAGELPLQVGGAIRTGEDGEGLVKYVEGSEVRLGAETYYEVREKGTLGWQESGSARYKVPPQKQPVGVETPHGVTAVLGTDFRLDVTATQTTVTLQEGKIRFTNRASESIELTPGQQLTVTAGQPLGTPAELDPITLESLFTPGVKLPAINQR
ncbi:MAG: hypothetical protein OZSIB_1697 [Candidatus Ozemobacter sibiricus]|jgi:ferric-dicitrate binding protein FerR (iron transport regulator)|uniref:FecR protein domain-containing protein n=1 Tax=Candidatus Ozemobacter sibiricus TaxID=2268124 RepID=A0A367ZLD1_9BACT|nr:MAG: hypothetical protein OZSIB_1697 [Candidatus Ozemobacter sibiricus]